MEGDIEKIEKSAQATHDSTIRQEATVANLVNTVSEIKADNKEDHEKLFSSVGDVKVSNAKKMSAKDALPWIIVMVTLIGFFVNNYATKQSAVEVRYEQPPYGNVAGEHRATEGGLSEAVGRALRPSANADNRSDTNSTGN